MCLRLSCQFMAGFVALECARHLLCSCFSGSWEHQLDRIRLRGVGERSLVKRSMKSATWFISKFVAYCGKRGSWLVARIGITPCSGIYISFHQSKEQSCSSISNEDMLTRDFENGSSLTAWISFAGDNDSSFFFLIGLRCTLYVIRGKSIA